ncbi:MAG: MICOS complex subunit MIC60 [Firmicutes bacterium]|nr:MICOS complex subunit MIC60 [Bacillota bacterium]
MKQNMIMKKLIGGIVLGSIVLTMGAGAFAVEEDSATGTAKASNFSQMKMGMRHKMHKCDCLAKGGQRKGPAVNKETLETVLSELVEDGTLTQSEAEGVIAFLEDKAAEKKARWEEMKEMTREERKEYLEAYRQENQGQRTSLFGEMVEEGILSEAQVDAIREKKHEKMQELKREKMNEWLSAFVEDEVITQDQADDILDFMEQKAEERKAHCEEIKDMTSEERKEYLEQIREEKKNIFEEMVEEGVITQEQADEMAKNKPGRRGKRPHKFRGMKRPAVSNNDDMV